MTQITFRENTIAPIFTSLLEHMAKGGSELDYLKENNINYGKMQAYIMTSTDRVKLYAHAHDMYAKWFMVAVMDELRAIAHANTAMAFNADGTIKDIDQIPECLQRAIQSIEVEEIFQKDIGTSGQMVKIGEIKKIKFNDKNKALDTIIKKLGGFIQRVEVSGSVGVVHSVQQFDLDERLKMLRTARPTVLVETVTAVEDAIIIEKTVSHETESIRAGSDI